MPSFTAKQQAFFSIRRLPEMTEAGADDPRDEMIEIYLVLNGEVAIAGKEFRLLLENDNLYCVCRNEYSRAVIKAGTAGYVIRFNKGFLYSGDHEIYSSHFPAFHSLVLRNEVIKIGASFLKEAKKICDMMHHEFNNQNDFSMQILSGYLSIFLLHLVRKSNLFMYVTGNESQHILARKFNALLEQKFRTSKKVSDYAALLFVSPNYLNQIVKQTTGKSAGILIRQRVALEAVRQVKLKGVSMKEVAYDLGFNDNAHFSKFFKKAAGKNFTEIRKYLFNKTMVSFNRL